MSQVSASGFGGGLVAGQAVQFTSGVNPVASGAGGRFLYNTSNGQLSWDADGSGAGGAVLIATFLGNPALTASSILVSGIAASAALDEAGQAAQLPASGEADAPESDAFDFAGLSPAPAHGPHAFGGGGAFGLQVGAWVLADPLDSFGFADGVGGFMSGEIGASLGDMLDIQRGLLGSDAMSPI